jgi:drug/metabolite transporter (DMT)-like permease
MLTVLIGLFAALSFGAADFAGGMGTKRLHALAVTGVVAIVGLIVLVSVSLLSADQWSAQSLLWGGLSGLAGLGAIGLLYACLARGPMSVLSPTTAVLSALVPMTWGALTGEALSGFVYPALALALVAAVLVGFIPDERAVRPTPTALLMAVGSGLLIGLFYIFIDIAPADSGITPLVANRAIQTTLVVVLLLVMVSRKGFASLVKPDTQWVMSWKKLWSLVVIGGVLDATANILILTGFRLGDMTIVAVLTALYPAGTILLAAVVLRERIQPVQWVGLALALIASLLLAQ